MDGIDESCRLRFEAHRREGGLEPVESFLPASEDGAYLATLEELLLIDFEFRWKAWCRAPTGREPKITDARTRFAELDDQAWTRLEAECGWLPAHYERSDADRRIGRYAVGPELGRGASAVVYRAHDPDLHRDVALKLTLRELADRPDRLERVRREARSAAGLRHPGIVTVHEVGSYEGRPYFALELVEGETLQDRLEGKPIDPAEAALLVAKVADAVGYAHEMGVVHRDIKPGNILLESDGRPRLTDFGLAHLATTATEFTRHGEVLGTPAYMAPEQARGESVDGSADVYALGVLLFELLTGRRPFDAPTAEATLYAVVHDSPAAPTTLNPDLAGDIETICLKAMAREPERRYENAQALARDLRAYLAHRPIDARPPSLAERALLWRRRNPALALSIGGGLLAVLVVGLLGLTNVLHERSRFREQRDVAERNLVASLLGQAGSVIEARDANWQPRASALIRQAAALIRDETSRVRARTLLARCESAVGPSLRQVALWPATHGAARALCASPDGREIAALTDAGALWVRRLDAAAPHLSTELDGKATRLAWHANSLLVGYADGRLELRNAETLVAEREVSLGSSVDALALHPHEPLAVVGLRGGRISLRELPTLDVRAALTGHPGGVTAASFSVDGDRIASVGRDVVARFWSWRDGAERSSATEINAARFVAFLNDGHAITSSSEQYGFSVVDIEAGETLPVLWRDDHPSGPITSVFVTRAARVVTTSIDGTIAIWTVSRTHGVPTAVHAAHGRTDEGAIRAAAYLPIENQLVIAHMNGTVSVWDLEASGAAARFYTHQGTAFAAQHPRLIGTEHALDLQQGLPGTSVSWGIDPIFAMERMADGTIVFAHESGRLVVRRGVEETVVESGCGPATAFGVFGDRIVVGSGDGRLWIGSAKTADGEQKIESPLGAIHAVVDLPREDELLVVAGRGVAVVDGGGAVRLVDERPRTAGAAARHGPTLFVAAPDGTIERWDAAKPRRGRVLTKHASPVTDICLVDAGRGLLSLDTDGRTQYVDLETNEARPLTVVRSGDTCCVSGDGTYAALGRLFVDLDSGVNFAWALVDGPVTTLRDEAGFLLAGRRGGAWRVSTKDVERALEKARAVLAEGHEPGSAQLGLSGQALRGGHSHRQWDLAASPDGRFVASAGHQGAIGLWNAADLTFARQIRGPGPLSWTVAFSPDSALVACGSGNDVRIHDVASGELLGSLEGHQRLVSSVRFSPRDAVIVTTAADDTVRLWDADTYAPKGRLKTGARIAQAAFSPQGDRLVGAGRDGSVYLWDIGPEGLEDGMAPTRRFEHGAPAWCVAFDATGTLLASGSEDGRIRIRDAATGALHLTLEGESRLRNVGFSSDGRYLVGACWSSPSTIWDLGTLRERLATAGLDWE